MAEKLQKCKYSGKANTLRSTRTTRLRTPDAPVQPPPTGTESLDMAAEDIKAEVLSSLREEISKSIRDELKSALSEDFNALKSELQGMRSAVANNSKAIQAEVNHMKADMQDMKGGLSTLSDEVTSLQATVTSLQSQVATLKDRCEDMEGRMTTVQHQDSWRSRATECQLSQRGRQSYQRSPTAGPGCKGGPLTPCACYQESRRPGETAGDHRETTLQQRCCGDPTESP